ncbi:MAG: glycosyltransferase family 4 protein [Proteobacteria bacterium]|nr:glycosyltransferase family 4 protein [Pseudomonadota bacterium]MBU1581834.1 glycosyltransferase family 4 protein [Pseudomonadota bacterium]MBU2452198.1 glycosyltransferase family 4 protein [Pseudomonadota bacterium]MBU2627888.1 glycosyltransferase family 4 protein [Pseudomonadota bacterium]
MKKKILMLLSNAFDPDPRVQREAVALASNGYEVHILCWDRDLKAAEYEVLDDINIHRVYVQSTHGRGATQIAFLGLFWIKAFVKGLSKQFDYVHAHDFDTLPLGYALSKIKKAKLIYDSHESYVDMLYSHPVWLKKLIFSMENFFLKRVDLLITVGEKLRNHFEKRGAKNNCVVGNWQDPEKFIFTKDLVASEREKIGISKNQKVISFIANLGIERQVLQLVEAVKQTPDIFLIIGGNGACRQLVETAAKECRNIHYLGYVKPHKIPMYTACSDIVFYGFDPHNPNARFSAPNKLFEGLAAGKIILTCDFGEIGKIVKETQCGIILDSYSVKDLKKAFNRLLSENSQEWCQNSLNAGKHRYNLAKAISILCIRYNQL